MKLILAVSAIFFTLPVAHAEDVFRIEIGKNYKEYSDSDLRRRVWDLERAVFQLQQKVFMLETSKSEKSDTWVCTIEAMGNTFTGTGGSKAVAIAAAIKDCKDGRDGDGFFCKNPNCKQ